MVSKVHKQYKRIKRDHDMIQLSPVDIPDSDVAAFSLCEAVESESDGEMEEPLILFPLPPIPEIIHEVELCHYVPAPVISFENQPEIALPLNDGTQNQKLEEFELPMIRPSVPHRAIPVEITALSVDLSSLSSGRVRFELEAPHGDIVEQVKKHDFRMVYYSAFDVSSIEGFAEVVDEEQMLLIVPRRVTQDAPELIGSLFSIDMNDRWGLLKQFADETRRKVNQTVFTSAPSLYNEYLMDSPTLEAHPSFFASRLSDTDLMELIEVSPVPPFSELEERGLLNWNYHKALIEMYPNLKKDGIVGECPVVSAAADELLQLLATVTKGVENRYVIDDEPEHMLTNMEWCIYESMDEEALVSEPFSALDAIQSFLFLKGKSTTKKSFKYEEKRTESAPSVVRIDVIKELYRKFSLGEKSTYRCIASSNLFLRKDLVHSLELLRFEFVERDLMYPCLILDSRTAVVFYPFRKLLRTESFSEMVKSELSQIMLLHSLHFSALHIVFEKVQPEQDSGKLKVYPFTPPVISSLLNLHRLIQTILKPEMNCEVSIWYSDTCAQSAWIARMVGEVNEYQQCSEWLARDWMTEYPTEARQPNLA
jgi:hypothetical protein